MRILEQTEIDSELELKITSALVYNEEFCRKAVSFLKPELLHSSHAQLVCDWACMYFRNYRKPAGSQVKSLFQNWAAHEDDIDHVETVSDYLLEVRKCKKKIGNGSFVADAASKYIRRRSVEQLVQDLQSGLDRNMDPELLEETLAGFRRVESEIVPGFNPFSETDRIYDAFASQSNTLFQLPGAAGRFMNASFVREGFLAFQGPEKRGKSWWLMEMAYRAFRHRNNVAFFQAGDMNDAEQTERLQVRLAGRPTAEYFKSRVKVPIRNPDYDPDDEDSSPVLYKELKFDRPLSWKQANRLSKKFLKYSGRGREFKLVSYSNGELTVSKMRKQLELWESIEGFVPDVVVVDYADILGAEPGTQSYALRDQINESWKSMRRLSQDRKHLLITATQADINATEVMVQKAKNFSEDKRKLAHVTGLIGLNQTEEEKDRGIMRLNWIVRRKGRFSTTQTVKVLQCPDIGRILLDSYF